MSDQTIQQYIDQEAPPDLRYPRVSHVVAIAPVGLNDQIGAPFDVLGHKALNWRIREPHPLMPEKLIVLRMFRRATGIKVYSVSQDGKMGVLDFLPLSQVIFASAIMEPAALIYELAACESGTDEDSNTGEPDDDDDEDGDDEPEAQAGASDGQQTSTSS